MTSRAQDEKLLAILTFRRVTSTSRAAKRFGLTEDHVSKVCRAIRDADIMHSNEEKQKILLHYPQR